MQAPLDISVGAAAGHASGATTVVSPTSGFLRAETVESVEVGSIDV